MFSRDSLIFACYLHVTALCANQCVTGVGSSVVEIVWPAVRDELQQLNTPTHDVYERHKTKSKFYTMNKKLKKWHCY